MICPNRCKPSKASEKPWVYGTNERADGTVRRYRMCPLCGHQFRTVESPEKEKSPDMETASSMRQVDGEII